MYIEIKNVHGDGMLRNGEYNSTKAFGTSRWGRLNCHYAYILFSLSNWACYTVYNITWVRFNVVYTLAYFCLYVIQHTWARLYKLSVRYISDLCIRLLYIHGRMFVQRLESGPVYSSVPTPPTSCSKWFTARQRTSYPLRTPWCWPTTFLASSHKKVSTLL